MHEARGYNRLAGMARGRILLLIQDDELFDANDGTRCAWLRNAVTVFDRFPAVGVVGMKMYLWAFGPNNTHDGMYFRDPATQLEVQFVLNADYAPLAMRKWVAWGCLGLRHGQGRCTGARAQSQQRTLPNCCVIRHCLCLCSGLHGST